MPVSNNELPVEDLPEAILAEERRGFSLVWLVPMVALAIALVMVYRSYMEQGPEITILFAEAEGVVAGKTRIKYRDVVIGMVTDVGFSEDFSQVVISADMDRDAEALLGKEARFWIVRPRIGVTGASGLGTLVSGVYIAMDPGKKSGRATSFTGLSEPPRVLSDANGRLFRLQAESLGSIAVGSPVYYRQVTVGRVTGYELLPEEDRVLVDVFIDTPHDRLVRTDSRFWNVSGLKLDLSGEGVRLELESVSSLLAGGIAFDTPESLEASEIAPEGRTFTLYASREASEQRSLTLTVPYVLYFEDTVRGLNTGAPVEFRGIRVGTVKDIRMERDPDGEGIRIPVLITLEPERVPLSESDPASHRPPDEKAFREMMENLVARGMRARLSTGNLLTGQLFVDFEFLPDASPASIDYSGRYPVIPTAPTPLANLLSSLEGILAKLEKLPLEEIGAHLLAATVSLDELLSDPRLKVVPERMDSLLLTMDQKSGPLLDELHKLGGDLRGVTEEAQKTLRALRKSASSQGAMGAEALRALQEFSGAARAVRSVADYLERHPEALLQGKRR